LLFFAVGAFATFSSASAQAPDAAPSTPVDVVELAPFEPTREDAVLEAYVDGVVAAHMREHKAPAVSVSVVKNGRIVFARAYGDADVDERVAADGVESLFRIGSVSKTFIWTAVMMLHERGLIDLDEDVNVYLKDVVVPEAFGAPVTMKHLMAHRAGFEESFGLFTVSDADEVSLTDALNAHMPKRIYPPGARTSYSNWGSGLAAKVVEDVSGVSYEEFLQNEILAPLSMTHTTLLAPALMSDDTRANLSKGYMLRDGAYEEAEFLGLGPFAPAGAMSSTAYDMAQWMLLHLGGGGHDGVRLMRSETHALMVSRPFQDRMFGSDMTHGFQSERYRGVETFGHGGATAAYYTNMMMAPELGLGVFISQSATTDRTLVSDLHRLVIDHILQRPADPARDDPAFIDAASAFAGTYLGNRRSFSQFEKLFALGAQAKVAAAQDGALVISGGGESIRFAPLPGAQDTFESRDGQRIVFGRNDAGAVTHFSDDTAVHSYERVDFKSNVNLFLASLGVALFFSVTTLLGAWRRQGRDMLQRPSGALLGWASLAGAGLVIAFAMTTLWVITYMSSAGVTAFASYPPAPIVSMRFAGLAVFAFALMGVISLWPAWNSSGWSIWRKLHHSLFALSLAFLGLMLVIWNVVFAATA
ncbi:MAG: serine hydrolase domain-containing protein, partial [Pseudomonadota bacterium]